MTLVWPRRASSLAPGQRLLDVMPRFSDNPTKPSPPVPAKIELAITIDGDERAVFDIDELVALGCNDVTADFNCVTTWSVRDLRWRGIRLSTVLEAALGEAKMPPFLTVVGADGYRIVLTSEDALGDGVLIATHLDENKLGARHGPLRLVSPEQYGYKNLKHLCRIDLRTEAAQLGGKEHLRARVAFEERHPKIPGRLLRWPYRLLIPPTAWLAERSERRALGRLQ